MTENNPNGSIMDLMDLMINYAGYPILWWITSYVSQIPHVLLLTPLPSGGANSFQHSILRAQGPRKRCELVLSLLMSRKKPGLCHLSTSNWYLLLWNQQTLGCLPSLPKHLLIPSWKWIQMGLREKENRPTETCHQYAIGIPSGKRT